MRPSIDRLLTVGIVLALPILCIASGNNFYKSLLVFGVINGIAATGMCLMLGFAGVISIGQAAFFGLGAYVTALAGNRMNMEPLAAVALGAVTSMVVGWLISRPLSRLNDHYLAMATLAFGTIMYIAFANASPWTGGLDPGISLSKFTIMGHDFSSMDRLFGVVWCGLVLVVFVAGNVASTSLGRSLRAMRMSPAAAASIGVDVVRAKAFVFAIASLMTGFAGGLFAYFSRTFNAGNFGIGYSIDLLMMVVIGSLNRISGALVGAFIITALPVFFDNFEDYKTLVFGVTMVLIMKFMPSGMVDGVIAGVTRLVAQRSA